MKRALLAVLLATACGEVGVTVEVSAAADVPPLDRIRIEAVQGSTLVEQTFLLGDKQLPQSVAVVSKGLTRGKVDITVQGLSGTRVEAVVRVTAELKSASQAQRVKAELMRLCPPGGAGCGCTPVECPPGGANPKVCGLRDDGCGGKRDCGGCPGSESCGSGVCRGTACVPKTCAELQAACGLALDGCGRTIDCGRCDAGLNCGGGGGPNTCGPGNCTPRTRCDAGMECGSSSDGCGGVISCGNCPQNGVCGTDNRCPCVPATSCPPGKQCGPWPNGCGTGMLDCGSCTLPETCMGGGVPNQCGCTPLRACPPNLCGVHPDGCGGTINCGNSCVPGRACTSADAGTCACSSGLTDCDGGCVDVLTDRQNCGSCGHTCPGGQSCWNGTCPCVDAGSNADGHCCPPGWFLSGYLENPNLMRCFKGPFDAGTQPQALATCQLETDAGYGRAASALASLSPNAPQQTAAPLGACGSFLHGSPNVVIDAELGNLTASRTCVNPCTSLACTCTTCNCAGQQRACAQKFYCVMDPLAPRVEGPCTASGQCPPGMLCQLGTCTSASQPWCVVQADCPGSGDDCNARGGGSQTGICQ